MQAQDPLAQLQPLRTPADIGWWPPAPGWWLLGACVLALLAALCWLLWRRHQRRRYRRQAATRLKQLHAGGGDRQAFAAACNQLLKAVALRSFPRQQVAALSGERWLEFLNRSAPSGASPRFTGVMLAALYQPAAERAPDTAEGAPENHYDDASEQLYRAALDWIKHHRRLP